MNKYINFFIMNQIYNKIITSSSKLNFNTYNKYNN